MLHSLVKLFEDTLTPPSADADDVGDDDAEESELDSWAGKPGLLKLLQFCSLKSKSEMVQFCLCPGAFDGAGKSACINCKCTSCGFAKIWSNGLRKHVVDVVDGCGNVMESAPIEFQSTVKWNRVRSSKKTEPGEAKQPSYEAHSGTVVEFLDAFERDVMKKYPHHRFTIKKQLAFDHDPRAPLLPSLISALRQSAPRARETSVQDDPGISRIGPSP